MNKRLVLLALLLPSIAFMNKSYSDEVTSIDKAGKIYSIIEGTSTDYNFDVVDKDGNTKYYKINLNPNNMSNFNQVQWSVDPVSDGTAIPIILPNGQYTTLYYSYTKPETYNYVNNQTTTFDGNNAQNKTFRRTTIRDVNSNYNGHLTNSETTTSDINADFLSGYNHTTTTTRNSYGGAIYNSGTINNINGVFVFNTADALYLTNTAGGAIYNIGAINNINSDFISNNTSTDGGAIFNNGTIQGIYGNFIDNFTTGGNGGAIYNTNYIKDIKSDFLMNFYSGSGNSYGGAIYNSGTIDSMIGDFIANYIIENSNSRAIYGSAVYNEGNIKYLKSDFIGNNISTTKEATALGGAVYNATSNGLIIDNSNFISNYVVMSNYDGKAEGGAIYAKEFIPITNSIFIGNYAKTGNPTGTAKGGAIYANKSIDIIADNGLSLIKGNYTLNREKKDNQAIFVNTGADTSATLKLNAVNNGEIIIDDKIAGGNTTLGYKYKVNITGDNTSSVSLNNEVQNANATLANTNLYMSENAFSDSNTTLTANSGTIHMANGDIEDYQINKLTSNPDTNYTIDVDTSNPENITSDTISTGDGSSGTITISEVNTTNNIDSYTTQVLLAQDDNIQLDLTDELKNGTTTTSTVYTSDEMKSNVNWDETFNSYKQDTVTTSSYSLATTNTTNDSITYNTSSTTGEKTFVGTNGDTLALLNQYETTDERNFNFNSADNVYTVTDNLGVTAKGTLNINGVANESNRSTIDGNSLALFVLDQESKLNFKDVKITNAQSVVTGTNTKAEVTLDNVEMVNNTNGIKTAGSVTIKGNSTIANNGNGIEVTSNSSIVTLDATDSVITLNDKITGVSGSKLNLKGGTINIAKKISVLDMSMDNTNVNLQNDNVFNGADLLVKNQSTLNMTNNATNTMYLNSLNLNDNLNMNVDVDLANRSMDRIIASNYNLNNYFVNVTKMNLLSDSDSLITKILFADNNLKDNVTTTVSEVAYSPIWKYSVAYDKTSGQFIFTRGGDSGGGGTTPLIPTVNTLNPAVLTSPVAAQLGGYIGMVENYEHAFNHMDMYMLKPYHARIAEANANKYAIADNPNTAYISNEFNSPGIWFRPYANYDSVRLKHGPKVNNFSYGSFIGGDSALYRLKNGFIGEFTPYIAYNGSHQSFSGNSIYQNGGSLGFTGSLYKGNFFTGITAAIGASVADASTMFGNEDFPMLMAGIANKTGYNFEFNNGRYIIQPSLLLSYTFVNTFDYTNGAGVKISSDPLHALQISPNIKFVMNTKNGWQPYLTAGMNWNLIDETKVSANLTSLPDMSIKPYVQYGIGVQKTMQDRFTAFIQLVFRNGGRNGIAATGGMKYYLDKNKKSNKKKVKEKV